MTKPLMSATKVTDLGNEVSMSKGKGKITAKSGKGTAMKKEGNVFVFDAWTQTQVFPRRG